MSADSPTSSDPSASHPENRLAQEKSPYLLQHKHNPVDWYAWGEEAFAKARAENKMIFLSIGYSTCHWCHVMERESFENPSTAELMNEHFVNVKVDREERPDVDRVYMAFVQATTGQGGWPMSVFLTPDLKPVAGGTYFPPRDQYGRPGFPSILQRVANLWSERREDVLKQADSVVAQLRDYTNRRGESEPSDAQQLGVQPLVSARAAFTRMFDKVEGGFGSAPKFPRPSVFNFLLREADRVGVDSEEGKRLVEMVTFTLRRMALGGMNDHLGGGFHRYSVDEFWHVPHFEKMLYDQAQLAVSYLEAYQLTGAEFFAKTARDVLAYVKRDMTSPGGGFYSAEDADSLVEAEGTEKAEGAFYVWTATEIDDLLGEDAELFRAVYGVEPDGNAPAGADPHGEFVGKNILIQRLSVEEAAQRFDMPAQQVEERLAAARETLFGVRGKRPRPHLDDKAITAWNGLMISAFAKGYQVLGDESYLEAAKRAARFVRDELTHPETGELIRSYREGPADVSGFAEDYAFLTQGLLDLYEAGFDSEWLRWADELQAALNEHFWDNDAGGYFANTGQDDSVILRLKEDYDGAEPSANSVAALNLLRLAAMTDNEAHAARANELLDTFRANLEQGGVTVPQMLVALDFAGAKPTQVVLAVRSSAEADAGSGGLSGVLSAVDRLMKELHRRFVPRKVVLLADGGEGQAWLAERVEFIKSVAPVDGLPTAFVCENFVCQLPTNDARRFGELLAGE